MKNEYNYPKSRAMRFAWLVVLIFFTTLSLIAQVTVKVENQPIRQILKEIEKSSNYKFFYNDGFTALNKTATLNVTNQSIDETLQLLFEGSGVAWEKKENNLIVLTPSKTAPAPESKKGKGVTGVVTDEKGEPIIGANVMVKGTINGTITDIDGRFKLDAADNSTLVVSYIGYLAQQINVKKSTNFSIKLVEDTKLLDEVVVVGYGSVKRKDVTTSVAIVSTKDINERPIISAAAAIQGKAAGVSVIQPSGEPGAGMVVRVRGNTSIGASNDPLYVVDGVPMSEINFLSPNDIESMQVLKDASSAAIYGSKGANGVVLITTKSGSKGEAKLSFSAFTGVTQVARQMKSLNVAQYKALMDEIGAATIPDGLTDKTDWFKETYRTGVSQNYQFSLSNATDKLKYFVSAGVINEKGVIPVAYYKRYNFRANLENQIRSWFKLGTNLAYSDYTNNGIISGTGSNRAGVILSVINTPTYAPIWDPANPKQYYNNFYGAQVTHPIENMSRSEDNMANTNRLVGSVSGEITFAPELKLRSSASLDRVYYHSSSFLDPVKTSYGRSQYGAASDNRSLSTTMVVDNILTYDKLFEKHSVSLMGGTSNTTANWDQIYMSGSHYYSSDIKTLNAANKIDPWGGTSATARSMMSYIGRAAYNYDSKYLMTVNFRADGSSKLDPAHRWGYFPSASAAWRMSSENFMKGIEWLDDLKVRGGWGQTGNESGIGDYSYLQMYNISRINWWETGNTNAVPALTVANMKNSDLTWETTTQTNLGLDLSILKNRVNLTFDAYYKYTTNLLINVPLPSTSSITSLTRNEGEMSNRGLEIALSTKNMTRKFKWDTDFNISFNRNKVEKFNLQQIYFYGQTSEATSETIIRMTPGQPLSRFWGYVSEGVDPETGDLKYKDVNGDGKISLSDKTYIGNPNPDFTFGLTNNFSYKGLSLNVFFQGSYGNDIYNASRMETEGMYDAKNQSIRVLDRWERPGMVTYMPRATSQKDNLKASTRFVEDGSFLRLKTLTLSYNLSSRLLKKASISRLQPYFTAQNLWTLTKYRGFDPEVNQYGGSATTQGIDWGTYPQSRSFVFGLNVEF
ncbi:MAG: SusC/RagA family TonB-linked outer membrane protein [Bacteroidales bacterium]|nr:SusC/RagA family TonB-linked outer membrane protein [Bacteroidales bacterium]